MRHIYSKAHKLSSNHKELLRTSDYCGCFYCTSLFNYYEINEWIEGSTDLTALCPYCGIDSVIPNHPTYNLTPDFLEKMKTVWF